MFTHTKVEGDTVIKEKATLTNESTTCPYCGKHSLQAHKHNSSEIENSVKELGEVIKNLSDKYPEAMNFCTICGSRLVDSVESAVCPICGNDGHAQISSIKHTGSEIERDVDELGMVLKDLRRLYPDAMNHCPACGNNL